MATAVPWDLEYDVVVGGYGYAGAMAAIAAHDEGAEVAIFEKMATSAATRSSPAAASRSLASTSRP